MGRAILAVIAGYLAMIVVVFALLSGVYIIIGADKAFQPATFDISTLWIVIMTAVNLAAAIIGGVVCAVVARRSGPVTALVIVVIALGLIGAIPAFREPPADQPTVRTADMSPMQAMMNARTPPIAAISFPIIGAIGVLIGARLVKRPQETR